MSEKIIWYIDEDKHELRMFTKRLRKAFEQFVPDNENLSIKGETARPTLYSYSDIIPNKKTSSILIDQRLSEEGTVNYSGIQLAAYFRSIDKKVPIYILTAYADDSAAFAGKEWNVEYIVSKGDVVGDDSKVSEIVQRMLRHINVYHEIIDGREKRFSDLIRKSLFEELTEKELEEFNTIQKERSVGIGAVEAKELIDLDEMINKLDILTSQIDNELDEKVDPDNET